MYVIKADGKLLYSPNLIDNGYSVISPRMHLEVNVAGSLEFTLPTCNVRYNDLHKLKSIVTVEQDGEEIFRGRVLEESADFYGQKRIYCEGDLSFLLDSLQAPFEYEGTAKALFSRIINAHNAQMDASKQFKVGIVTGLDGTKSIKVKPTAYADTFSTIQTLLIDAYGGYIQTRLADGVYYIDYLDTYNDECTQKIEFGVNLLNMDSQVDAQDMCSVLLPLGAMKSDGKQVTIADANNGSVYIENKDLIARYGRIYKMYTWDNATEPAQLLSLARQYMQKVTMAETLTISAVDLHLLNVDVDKIRKGCKVHLLSEPHAMDRKSICAALDIDIQNADKNQYTFGLPKQTIVGQAISQAEHTASQFHQVSGAIVEQFNHIVQTEESVNIAIDAINLIGHRTSQVEADIDAAEAEIALKANQTDVDVLGQRMSGAEARIDGAEAAIELKAGRGTVEEMGERLTTAEARIDGAEAEIALKASQTTVDELGEKVTSAEVRIDGMDSTISAQARKISLKADKTEIEGMLTVNDSAAIAQALSAQDVFCNSLSANASVWAEQVNTGDLITSTLKFDGYFGEWKSKSVVTDVTCTVETGTTPPFYNASGTMISSGVPYVKSVTITPTTETIRYLARKANTEG